MKKDTQNKQAIRILQLCHKMPYPPTDGGSVAIYNAALGFLEAGVSLRILAINPSRQAVDEQLIPKEFKTKTSFDFVNVDTRLKPINALVNLFQSESYFIQRFRSKAMEIRLKEVLQEDTFDIVQLEHLYMCLYIPVIRKYSQAKVILRTQNIEHVVWKRYIRRISNPLKKFFIETATKRLQRFERSAPAQTDGIIAITPDDAKIILEFGNNVPVSDVPVSFNFSQIKGIDKECQYINFPKLYHLGSMDWRPNEEAIEWFLKDIHPIILSQYPKINIYLAGKKMPKRFLQFKTDTLHIEGMVDDAIKFQEDKAILIVPLLSGSGIRAKIIEGMALGKTVISTTIGAQGIQCVPGIHLLIADTPEEFTAQIHKCIASKELCRKIGTAAKRLAEKEYQPFVCAQKMIEFYNTPS